MKKKKIILFLCAAVIFTLFSACSSKARDIEEVIDSNVNEEPVKLKVGMAGKDIKAVCVILAKSLGYYEEEGLDVQFEAVSTLNDGVTAMSMNKMDILPYGFIPSATFISKGADVVVYGGTISEGSQAICKAENSNMINAINDLRGKKIGFVRPETGQMVIKGLMREAGLDLSKDVELIALDSFASIAEAVSKGELDLGIVNSGYSYIAEKMGLAVAFDVADYVSNTVCCRQTASRDAVENKREALVAFQVANLRAFEVYFNDKETTIKTLMDYSGQDRDYVEELMYNGVMVPILDPCLHKIVELYQIMKDNGDIDADSQYDIVDKVDITIYRDALEEMILRKPESELYKKLLEEYKVNNL